MILITISGLPQTVMRRELRNILSFVEGFQSFELDHRFVYPLCHASFNTTENAINARNILQGMILEPHSILQVEMGRQYPYAASIAMDGQTASSFFASKLQDWFSTYDRTLSRKRSWFNYIKDDLTRILRVAAEIWSNLLVHPEYTSVFTHDPMSSLFVTDDQRVKVLPVFRTRGGSDIDHLNHFIRYIICLPFQLDTDINRMIRVYNLNNKLGSYLHFLCEPNLLTIGSRMLLLGHPFTWINYQKSKFMIRMDEMIKSNWIDKQSFFNALQSLAHHPLVGWDTLVTQDNDAILVRLIIPWLDGILWLLRIMIQFWCAYLVVVHLKIKIGE
ncbi:hypothetical protein V6N13_023448 [Hibiscus sabdariffa]|uniref:Uncharacterized protein n=1 Tax=Hibiscus sabdariffa TaxID=183260 RepID=A0ABR2PM84_9ROSI